MVTRVIVIGMLLGFVALAPLAAAAPVYECAGKVDYMCGVCDAEVNGSCEHYKICGAYLVGRCVN